MMAQQADRLVIGIGQDFRRDDQAGPRVIEGLKNAALENVDLVLVSGESASLLTAWQGYKQVWVVDAVRAEATPGTLIRLDGLHQHVPDDWRQTSTHGVGLAHALALARVMDRLPPALIIWGIVGAEFGIGVAITPDVQTAIDDAVAGIAAELEPSR